MNRKLILSLIIFFGLFLLMFLMSIVYINSLSWDITTAKEVRPSLDISDIDVTFEGLFLNSSGTSLFFYASNDDRIYQYELSTPWNITTATNIQSLLVSSVDLTGESIFFNSSGTALFFLGSNNDRIYQYELSTPWNITTATNIRNFSVASQDSFPKGLFLNSSGTALFVLGGAALERKIYQYELSTPWNITNASYTTKSFSIQNQDATPEGMVFNESGTALFVLGDTNNRIYQYILTTPWDITSALYTQYLSVSTEDTTPSDLFLNSSGTALFVLGDTNDRIYQYELLSNHIPSFNDGYPSIASTDGTNQATKNLETTFIVTDNDVNDTTLRYNITWYTNNNLNFSLNNIYYTNGTTKIETLQSRNLTKGQTWKSQINIFDNNTNVWKNTSGLTIANTAPQFQRNPVINSTLGRNLSNQNLNVYFTPNETDVNDLSNLNYSVMVYTNNNTNFSIFRISTTNGTFTNFIINSNNLTEGQTWKAMVWVGDGSDNSTYQNTSELLILPFNAPTIINNYTYPQLIPTLNSYMNWTIELNGTELNDGIEYVYFNITASNGTLMINNQNMTLLNINGQIYNWTSGNATRVTYVDDGGTWRMIARAKDNASTTETLVRKDFTISDSTSPTLNITHLAHRLNPNNTNFSIDTTYRIQVNWTGTDNIRLNTMWYIFNHNSTNTTIPLYTNFTVSIPFAGLHNITLFANDTTGNLGSTFINFSVRNDTQNPSVSISSPSGTVTSQTVTTTHSISDNVEIYLARYSIYSGSTQNIANTTIENPSSNTTLTYTTTLGCSSTSYTLYMWANDTSGNENQVSSTYTCTTGGGGGSSGGGGSTTLSIIGPKAVGESCTKDSECSSSICDISQDGNKKSRFYQKCVQSLCGNGVQDEGETFINCQEDTFLGGAGKAGPFIKVILPLIVLISFAILLINQKKVKEGWKKIKKWI